MKNIKKGIFYLDWPEEICKEDAQHSRWFQPASNICLDFHGDPVKAQVVIFSDGNHHMALKECLELFKQKNKGLSEIFYATTPPGPIVKILRKGGLQMGNLVISAVPHVFISPPEVLNGLVADGLMSEHVPFVRNQGNVLLVKKGNPKCILNVLDLARTDIRLFLSNPHTEKASYTAYYNTLTAITSGLNSNSDFLYEKITQGQAVFGKCIHHREAPQAVADGSADVAVVFYHLALRYLRIFPDIFDVVSLGGSFDNPVPLPGNVVGRTHIGLVGDGGKWGKKLFSFLGSKRAMEIYQYHGLQPV
jgi:hypothetical protein